MNAAEGKSDAATVIGGAAADAGAKSDTTVAGAPPPADTKVEAKADATKAAEKAPDAKPIEWDKWSPKDVEGIKRDAKVIAQFRDVAKKSGLSAEQAQSLVEFSDGIAKAQHEAQQQAQEQEQNTWREQLKADPVIGGAKFKETEVDVARAMKAYGDSTKDGAAALRKAFNETRFGDHPELVKMVAWFGRGMREDKVTGGIQPPSPKQTLLDQLYGPPKTQS